MIEGFYVVVAIAIMAVFDQLRTRTARAEARSEENGREAANVVQQNTELRKEIRRLTDVIIQLKQDGYGAPPWAGNQDEHWGSYAITNEEELAEEERRARAAAAEADAGLREELENL